MLYTPWPALGRPGSFGFKAGLGYDQVTGLGSVDAFNLAVSWSNILTHPPRLVITQFTASTAARVGGPFSLSLVVANQGEGDAGPFRIGVLFTANGDASTAIPYNVGCEATGLKAGTTFTCHGTVTLWPSVTPKTYLLLSVADLSNAVPQWDRSGSAALASSGPLTVTQ
jgi:hypothetical protein